MLIKLSAKGQIVLPVAVRRTLSLLPGTELYLEVIDKKIILAPVDTTSPVDTLYSRFAGHDLLGDLEREHRGEI